MPALAGALGLDYRVFTLHEPAAIDSGIQRVRVVLNCAGPFSHTAPTIADACLRTGIHYLDITGEVEVFEHFAVMGAHSGRPRCFIMNPAMR